MLGGVRPRVRDLVGDALFAGRVTHPHRRHARRLTIVTFHRVLPPALRRDYPYPGLVATPDELAFCLRYFTRHYTCLPLGEAHAQWSRRNAAARPPLAVTFDDAALDNFEHARPVLAAAGVRATFFAPVDAVAEGIPLWHDVLGFALVHAVRRCPQAVRGALAEAGLPTDVPPDPDRVAAASKALPPEARHATVARIAALAPDPLPAWAAPMAWTHLRALAGEGHEIGSHSMSHPLLPQCDAERKRRELVTSRTVLERELDQPVTAIAYPNGDCDRETEHIAHRAGYVRGVTTRWGTNAPGAPALRLNRCDVDPRRLRGRSGALQESRLAWRLSGLHPGLRDSPP